MSRSTSRHRLALGAGALLATTVLVASCSSSEAQPAASDEASAADITVAMVTPESTGEFYGAMYCGAEVAAEEEGVTLNVQGTPGTSTEEVMQVLQSVLATDPDGLLLTVWDNNAFNATMEPYTSAGNPLVMPDSFLSNDEFVQSIRTDNYQSSYDAALQAIDDFEVTSGSVLVVTDAPGNAVQSSRAEGFRDALLENTDLEVLEFQYVGADAAEASQAVTSALAANPDLGLVFSTNIGAGTGAANAIRTSGAEAVHIGFDTASAQVEELREGSYDALIAQSPYQMGYESTVLISQILKGETDADSITEKVEWSPWALVTQDNVDSEEIASFLYSADCS
ncbi:substrate-binding domain-containing protein [Microbacterium oryzae]|uniref:substrate-binding domain-containing protein n=1 Tax=Microbacterium oryzae TaxID=743009 RepID=UPI0025AF3B1C|nr:substrate-binding domain-containing protein [Microbacterium oryzae]MDN3310175.1 substrate-binding domain-containing protein [Microbacterium oryzae]